MGSVMFQINDPMLALILRFIGKGECIDPCNEEFIQNQIHEIQQHIEQFPPKEQQARALKWIERHAKRYREKWEKEVVSAEFSKARCADCPLAGIGNEHHCEIHGKWLLLLQQYTSNEINSEQYVKDSLALLTDHKNEIRLKNVPILNQYFDSTIDSLALILTMAVNYRTLVLFTHYEIVQELTQGYISLWKNSFNINFWKMAIVPT